MHIYAHTTGGAYLVVFFLVQQHMYHTDSSWAGIESIYWQQQKWFVFQDQKSNFRFCFTLFLVNQYQ